MVKKKGLGQRIRELFNTESVSEETFDQLEDLLIEGDVGVKLTMDVVGKLRSDRSLRNAPREKLIEALKSMLEPHISAGDPGFATGRLNFLLVLGVNGVGKTTAIARLVHRYRDMFGKDGILLCAGDTFRAGAVDQLETHAERLGVRVVKQPRGSDAGAVVFDAIESAEARGNELVIADTAGRMHNKRDLIGELSKIDRIIRKRVDPEAYHRMLVIDATTGQNALRQAEVFHEAVGVDSLFIAKYDSSGKGGIALSIAGDLGIPVSFVGTGESYDAMEQFEVESYIDSLVG